MYDNLPRPRSTAFISASTSSGGRRTPAGVAGGARKYWKNCRRFNVSVPTTALGMTVEMKIDRFRISLFGIERFPSRFHG